MLDQSLKVKKLLNMEMGTLDILTTTTAKSKGVAAGLADIFDDSMGGEQMLSMSTMSTSGSSRSVDTPIKTSDGTLSSDDLVGINYVAEAKSIEERVP